MKLKNKILGILISTIILSAIALTGVFEATLRGAIILMASIIGLMILVPYILEKRSKKQNR